MERNRKRSSSGHSLLELTISMGIAGILTSGFFQTFRVISDALSREQASCQQESTLQEALLELDHDIRQAGANPSANPSLFDGSPATDIALEIDPDADQDPSNAILVRADQQELNAAPADTNASDDLEAVLYTWDPSTAHLIRKVWRLPVIQSGLEQPGAESSNVLEGVCSFSLQYLDATGNSTVSAALVSEVIVNLTTVTNPGDCSKPDSFKRASHANIRLRNR